jgi:hypothetical protein
MKRPKHLQHQHWYLIFSGLPAIGRILKVSVTQAGPTQTGAFIIIRMGIKHSGHFKKLISFTLYAPQPPHLCGEG